MSYSRGNSLFSTLDLTLEADRIRTFKNWKVPFVCARRMAAAGLYYTNIKDKVKCVFCKIEIQNWIEGDNPAERHKSLSPLCRLFFFNKSDRDVNGTRKFNILNEATAPVAEVKLNNLYRKPSPAFPSYADYEVRVRSYEYWPASMTIKPSDLSEAGFIYTGNGDVTICFYCGGVVKDWVATDKPWEEHARLFGKCDFLLLHKGAAFVDRHQTRKLETSGELIFPGEWLM